MLKKTFFHFTIALLVSMSMQVNAALTSADWLVAGDNLITIDDNDLQWLDLTQTQSLSYRDVSAQLGAGGTFEGFRYATRLEVEGLWTSAGGNPLFYNGESTQNNGLFDILAPFWGDLYCQAASCTAGEGWSDAITAETSNPGVNQMTARIYDFEPWNPNTTRDLVDSTFAPYAVTSSSFVVGSALVRTAPLSPVPVPAALWLFGTALIGLVGFGKRRKAT